MEAAAEGTVPLTRHDWKEWGGLDLERMAAAGAALGFRCALIYIKGDWAEYAGTFFQRGPTDSDLATNVMLPLTNCIVWKG